MQEKCGYALLILNICLAVTIVKVRPLVMEVAGEPVEQQLDLYDEFVRENEAVQKKERSVYLKMVSSGQRKIEIETIPIAHDLTEEDYQILLRIVEAEAGGEDEKGKILVANVVLNRVKDEAFPDTVKDVVYQRSQGITQFSPVTNGSIKRVSISEETKTAVNKALLGEDCSDGAMYFAARSAADPEKMKWFDEHLTRLFAHGGHEFFRKEK